jgi:hypothetical protein
MKLSKQEYIAVMFDHDTGRWSVETDLIPDLTGSGDVWDNVTSEWDWLDSLGDDGVKESMVRVEKLRKLIEGEDING